MPLCSGDARWVGASIFSLSFTPHFFLLTPQTTKGLRTACIHETPNNQLRTRRIIHTFELSLSHSLYSIRTLASLHCVQCSNLTLIQLNATHTWRIKFNGTIVQSVRFNLRSAPFVSLFRSAQRENVMCPVCAHWQRKNESTTSNKGSNRSLIYSPANLYLYFRRGNCQFHSPHCQTRCDLKTSGWVSVH